MKDKLKKFLLPNLPYLCFVYLFDTLCQAVRLALGLDASEKLLHIGQGFQTAFASSAPSFHALDICVGILGAVLVRLAVYVKGKNAKKYRKGIEYGSARWAAEPEGIPRITENTADRALRLKTLGNAVCPPQAYPIFKYISMIETGECVSICPYGKAGGDA